LGLGEVYAETTDFSSAEFNADSWGVKRPSGTDNWGGPSGGGPSSYVSTPSFSANSYYAFECIMYGDDHVFAQDSGMSVGGAP
jgi:hypothetical protein